MKDIMLTGVTIIAGSKELLIDATVKFTRGRKYGLVGRNGTGKTTLINSICRKEIHNMPQNLQVYEDQADKDVLEIQAAFKKNKDAVEVLLLNRIMNVEIELPKVVVGNFEKHMV